MLQSVIYMFGVWFWMGILLLKPSHILWLCDQLDEEKSLDRYGANEEDLSNPWDWSIPSLHSLSLSMQKNVLQFIFIVGWSGNLKECWALLINICPWFFLIITIVRGRPHPYLILVRLFISCKSDHSRLSSGSVKCLDTLESTDVSCNM